MAFRYGGMKKALEFDAHLFMFTTCGLDKIWPRWEQVGGFPGYVSAVSLCLSVSLCVSL